MTDSLAAQGQASVGAATPFQNRLPRGGGIKRCATTYDAAQPGPSFFRGSPRGGGQKLCQLQPGIAPPQKSAALSNTQPKAPALLGAKNIPPD